MARALLASLLVLLGCPAEQQVEPQQPDPSLTALDRLARKEQRATAAGATVDDCLARAAQTGLCPPLASRRAYHLRMALDPRYNEHWPEWESRMQTTLDCVNRLYQPTGTTFVLDQIQAWDPGAARHNLRALLSRLQQDYPPDLKTIVVGITVWEERKVFSGAGGEIGLSQRAACVVPSWPRVENDCLTLAHELGHVVGARHVRGTGWVMSYAGHVFQLPAADPAARVVQTNRFHPRNVEAIRTYHRARFTPNGLVLPVSCAQRLALTDRCWSL